MQMVACLSLFLAALLAFQPGSAWVGRKCYKVTGKLICDADPKDAADVEIYLMDEDLIDDDIMGWTTTNLDGTFTVEGCGGFQESASQIRMMLAYLNSLVIDKHTGWDAFDENYYFESDILKLFVSVRGVRTFSSAHRKPPWPMFYKSRGWRENGPYYDEHWEWPERSSGWSVLPGSKVADENRRPIQIVAPDLTGFKLKPYVSYRMPETELTTRQITARDLYEVCCESSK